MKVSATRSAGGWDLKLEPDGYEDSTLLSLLRECIPHGMKMQWGKPATIAGPADCEGVTVSFVEVSHESDGSFPPG